LSIPIVEQHQGQIKVETETGAFTEFTLILPKNIAADTKILTELALACRKPRLLQHIPKNVKFQVES